MGTRTSIGIVKQRQDPLRARYRIVAADARQGAWTG